MTWQPISTAPKDGAFLILLEDGSVGIAFSEPRHFDGMDFHNTGAAVVGRDRFHDARFSISMTGEYLNLAIKWQPLPPPEQGQ